MKSWTRFEEHEDEMRKERLLIYRNLKRERKENKEILKVNQANSEEIMKYICSPIEYGTVESRQVTELSKISPYLLWEPIGIANLLIEKIDKLKLWVSPQYIEESLLIATAIRRHILVQILRNRGNSIFPQEFIQNLETKLESVLNWLNAKSDYPEQSPNFKFPQIFI